MQSGTTITVLKSSRKASCHIKKTHLIKVPLKLCYCRVMEIFINGKNLHMECKCSKKNIKVKNLCIIWRFFKSLKGSSH